MEWPESLQIIKDLKDCYICSKFIGYKSCQTCEMEHKYTDVVEAYQQAIFALKYVIESEKKEEEK